MNSPADWSDALQGLQPLMDWRDLPIDLASLAALAAGLGWASGLRLYALVFVIGLLGRYGGVHLPGNLDMLTETTVLWLSGGMLVAEFLADKVAWFDSLWDGLHTFIRIPAGAALAAAAMGDQAGAVQVAAGLAGGSLAASTHFAKAGMRAAINTSPEPFTNIAASLGEDGVFIAGLWLLLVEPLWFLVGLVVFVALALMLIALLWRFLKVLFRSRPRPANP